MHEPVDVLKEAMKAAQRGDADAYRRVLTDARDILEVYLGNVLQRMGKRTPATVDDLVQETLLAIHEKRHTYDPTQPFLPWLITIARYKAIDYGRREKTRSVEIHGLDDAIFADPTKLEPGAARDLERILAALPEKQRRIIELVKLEGRSTADAAARAGVSESALKVTVHRALKSLRARFKKESR